MKTNFKKTLSVLLAVLMLTGTFGVTAFAANRNITYNRYPTSTDVTLKDGFSTSAYTVSGNKYKTKTSYADGTSYTVEQAMFDRPGYVQDGWVRSTANVTKDKSQLVEGSTFFSFGSSVNVSSALSNLYPHWDAVKYTVTYKPGSAAGVVGSEMSEECAYNSTHKTKAATVFTRVGYKISGWATTDGASTVEYKVNTNITITGNLTLYPVWEVSTSTLSYNRYPTTSGVVSFTDGGEEALLAIATKNGSNEYVVNDPYPTGSTVPTLGVIFQREGYVMDGWVNNYSVSESDIGNITGANSYWAIGEDVTITGNLKLYPHWSIIKLNVTYLPGSAEGVAGSSVTDVVEYGKTFKTKDAALFTRDGYDLIGWSTVDGADEAEYKVNTNASTKEELVLYPVWEKITYSISAPNSTIEFERQCVDVEKETKTVVLTNDGNRNLTDITASNDKFDIVLSSANVNVGKTINVKITPKADLAPGKYSEEVVFTDSTGNLNYTLKIMYELDNHIFARYEDDGNATYTHDGTKTAMCSYGCGSSHTIDNPGSMKVVDAANNTAKGLETSYVHHRTVRFTAYGSGSDNTEPVDGIKRYVPTSWYVNEDFNGVFVADEETGVTNYDVIYTHTKYGTYTLVIDYIVEQYDAANDEWVLVEDETDTKSFTYTVGPTEEEKKEDIMPTTILSLIMGAFAYIIELFKGLFS
ncbi:MAG: InlB B-repeat-containing protein [Acutalibacteraceae bacterium]